MQQSETRVPSPTTPPPDDFDPDRYLRSKSAPSFDPDAYLKKKAKPEAPKTGGLGGTISKFVDPAINVLGDTGRMIAQGGAAAAAGGVYGLAKGAGAGIADLTEGKGLGQASDTFARVATKAIEDTEKKFGYDPKTPEGKAVASVLSKLPEYADKAGDVVSRGVEGIARQDFGASADTARRVGAGAGAVTNTAVQSLPAAIGPAAEAGVSALRGAAAAREAALRPRIEPTMGPATPPTGPTAPQGPTSPNPAGWGYNVNANPASAAADAAQLAAKPKAPPVNPHESAAQAYARSVGLDWSKLGSGVKRALITIAQDAKTAKNLDPAALRREALLQSQRIPVPATRGQLTRDPAELRREAIVSRTTAGQPIRDVDIQANRAVQANLEALRGRAAGLKGGLHEPVNEEGIPATTPSIRTPTKLPTQVGEATQAAVREKAKWSEKGYKALYKRARETEPDARASLTPVTDLLTENPEIQHLGWVQSWLNKAAKVKAPEGGKPVAMTDATLAELHDLRTDATGIARTGGKEGYYAGKLIKAIDQAMQDVPEGAKAWKAANEAYKAHQKEFKAQDTVRALATQSKQGGNRALALEKTWNKIAKGPLENLRQVKKTMLTGGTPQLREMGKRAWRDLRGETVNRILEDARNVVATDETERQILTAAALQKGIRSIPRQNLEELIGKRNLKELDDILRTAKITRTQPSARVTESGTVPNVLVMAEKALRWFPGIGDAVIGAAKGTKMLYDLGRESKKVQQSLETPLKKATQKAAKVANRNERRAETMRKLRDIERTGPTLPDTIGPALNTLNPQKPPP